MLFWLTKTSMAISFEADNPQRGAVATECSACDNRAGCRNTAVPRRAERGDLVARRGHEIEINGQTV